MNLEYNITFQDELDGQEIYAEYSLKKTWLRWWSYIFNRITCLFFSLFGFIYGTTQSSEFDRGLLYGFGVLFLILAFVIPFVTNPKNVQSYFNRSDIKKKWERKSSQQETRNIIVTDIEFIFKTETSELAWKWQALKTFFESKKGFIIFLFTGNSIHIPKKIFDSDLDLNNFREILQQHLNKNKNN